ncbi:MAG: glutathione S-transferase family protein [Pseudomonadota bacterium]
MTSADFRSIVSAANRQLGTNNRNRIIGGSAGSNIRFELYHAGPSLCSHKVRTVMAEKEITYRSHDMNIMPDGKAIPENYRPTYVRMRLLGQHNEGYATGYTGESSVSQQGLDPCVVPTLVDHQKEHVVVDSSAICEYLEGEVDTGTRLVPEGLAEAIAEQGDIVDRAPHVAILYGANPDGDRRPPGLASNIEGVQDRKIRALNAMAAELHPGDPLIEAYKAKISKESGSDKFVHDADSMRHAYAEMANHADDLEAQLKTHSGPWTFGADFTMADVMWTVSLYRLYWLGLGDSLKGAAGRPRVEEYVARAFSRPSFEFAVVNWPFGYSPSPHVPEMDSFGFKMKFLATMIGRRSWREALFG